MNELIKIHEEVKEHPYRLRKEDYKGYHNKLQELSEVFYKIINKRYGGLSNAEMFTHDFNLTLYFFNYHNKELRELKSADGKDYDYHKILLSETIIGVECFISQIHQFIITNKIIKFTTYSGNKINHYEYNEKKNLFERVKKELLSRKRLLKLTILELLKSYEKNNNEKLRWASRNELKQIIIEKGLTLTKKEEELFKI